MAQAVLFLQAKTGTTESAYLRRNCQNMQRRWRTPFLQLKTVDLAAYDPYIFDCVIRSLSKLLLHILPEKPHLLFLFGIRATKFDPIVLVAFKIHVADRLYEFIDPDTRDSVPICFENIIDKTRVPQIISVRVVLVALEPPREEIDGTTLLFAENAKGFLNETFDTPCHTLATTS